MSARPKSDANGDDTPVIADDSEAEELQEVPLPEEEDDTFDDEEPSTDALSFCELCGASECDDDELLRCEECGRLHCSACRELDDEDTPYCTECYDEIGQA